MITLGKISINYQTLEMGFRDSEGKKIVLRGMSTGAPRTVSAKRMEKIFQHGEVADSSSRRPTNWKSDLLVEYSKNKFACEILDGRVEENRYKVMDDVIFYKD